ncbi:MAG TPA: hypothetical protein VG324_13275 [Blastocatellia bacterium]|nr:hypothetical protein [Blastocatellia bacterium]
MDALVFVQMKNAQSGKKLYATSRRRLESAQTLGAAFGLMGGVLAALFGALFTVVSWFGANEGARHSLSTLGTTLLFLTIPLLIFGGYCLDWMEKDSPHRYSKVSRYDDGDEEQ